MLVIEKIFIIKLKVRAKSASTAIHNDNRNNSESTQPVFNMTLTMHTAVASALQHGVSSADEPRSGTTRATCS
jgi:hypothetical protein